MLIDKTKLVIDLNDIYIRAGWVGEKKESFIVKNIVGISDLGHPPIFGDECYSTEDIQIFHPIESSNVNSWEKLMLILDFVFNSFGIHNRQDGVSSTVSHVLILVPYSFPLSSQSSLTSKILKKYNIGKAFTYSCMEFVALALGLETALIVAIYKSETHVLPILNAFSLIDNAKSCDKGSQCIIESFHKLCKCDRSKIPEILRKVGFVSTNIKRDKKLAQETSIFRCKLPLTDGKTDLMIESERFMCFEELLATKQKTKVLAENARCTSVPQCIYESVESIASIARIPMYKSIIIIGDIVHTYMGILERIRYEVDDLGHVKKGKRIDLRFIDNPYGQSIIFIGGCKACLHKAFLDKFSAK
ncbi:Actin family like protein [Aduncisulcus paluster]|uniref:Actin family like protein n=1 Tax=Aduncisulcus paluster TaxID=2918883 RepID=A0ABQ5KUN9_9EUKA|nr:Actin family like protein [Aduncisulcus paluster]